MHAIARAAVADQRDDVQLSGVERLVRRRRERRRRGGGGGGRRAGAVGDVPGGADDGDKSRVRIRAPNGHFLQVI